MTVNKILAITELHNSYYLHQPHNFNMTWNLNARRTVCVYFTIFILLLSGAVVVADVTEFQVESTSLQVYRDGLVQVTQTLTVNETLPAVTLQLLGSSVDNFVVLDENQTLLDYDIEGINITVYTLGATNVSLQYDTDSLTSKEFEVWSLIVDTPYNLTVFLPDESTVVGLSDVPDSIEIDGDKITLSLFPSQWDVSYVFPLGSRAEFAISNFAVTPSEVKPGEEVTVSFKVTNVGGQSGSTTVPLIVNQETEDSETVTLEVGQSVNVEFKITKQTLGTYIVEVDGQVHEFTVTETPSDGTQSDGLPLEYIIAAVLVALVAAIIVVVVFVRRRGPNVEKIFRENAQLNKEERAVIQFLAENEGKAFEAEIRERFPDVPRTSLWRLIRRLEKLEIVKVKKIGLENRVELEK